MGCCIDIGVKESCPPRGGVLAPGRRQVERRRRQARERFALIVAAAVRRQRVANEDERVEGAQTIEGAHHVRQAPLVEMDCVHDVQAATVAGNRRAGWQTAEIVGVENLYSLGRQQLSLLARAARLLPVACGGAKAGAQPPKHGVLQRTRRIVEVADAHGANRFDAPAYKRCDRWRVENCF